MVNVAIITKQSMKESLLCTPAGAECHTSIKKQAGKCLSSCKGVFADVKKNKFEYNLNTIEDYENIMDEYKEYKNGYSQEYSALVSGMLSYVSL